MSYSKDMKRWITVWIMLLSGCAESGATDSEYANFQGYAPGASEAIGASETPIGEDVRGVRVAGADAAENVSTDAAEDQEDAELEGGEGGGESSAVDALEGEDGSPLDPDTTPQAAGAGLGQACDEGTPCEDAFTCEPWPTPEGVCTQLGCQVTNCPDGGVCVQFDATRWGCMPNCVSKSDCRSGDECKTLWKDGAMTSVCHAISNKASGDAGLCSFSDGCKGTRACMQDYAGGYCANLDCSLTAPCGVGGGCVALENYNACLKICDPSKPCPGGLVGVQSCAPAALVSGDAEDVCVEGVVANEVGEFCSDSSECISGDCKLTSVGYCAIGGNPCLKSEDCAEECVPSADFTFGSCVKTCLYGEGCPEETVCVPSSASTGECLKSCNSLSDIVSCGNAASCEYGFPLGPIPEGEGAYACKNGLLGTLGSACINDTDCAGSGWCLVASGGGTCVAGCGSVSENGLNVCDWGSVCVSTLGTSQCMKLCPKGNVQCTDGFSCQTKAVGVPFSLEVCLPD